MLGNVLIRFVLGGAIVSAFAAASELFKPKRFSGMFAAAPSVAITTLALAFAKLGPAYVAREARSMVIGGIALLIYCAACVVAAKVRSVPIWLTAFAGWALWLVVAIGLWKAGAVIGALQ
jgi:hypothetical protein